LKITKADVFWNYGATFMRVASALVVLPLILRMLSQEDVGLWSVMIGLNSMIYLLDFGFFKTFSRAVTYVFSGAQSLEKEGFSPVEDGTPISYDLLKGLIKAMSHFYGFVSLLLLILLFTGGVWYIDTLLENFSGDVSSARVAWYSYGILLCYQFFTYYYDAALVGRGMIKRSRQIIVFSQTLHIIISSVLLISGLGIISMVIGQSAATIVNRTLARRAFYDRETKRGLATGKSNDWFGIIKRLFNTAYKSGLASMSWVFTNRMLSVIGALYIPLTLMASYGITKQITDITITLSLAWFATYYPKLTGEQIRKGVAEVKRIYIKAHIIALLIFFAATLFLFFAGTTALSYIGSSTTLLPSALIILLFGASMLEAITEISTSVLLSRNEVPHYKAQSVTAVVAVILLFAALRYTQLGVTALIIVPLAAQLVYQHWRWTTKLWRDLQIKPSDYSKGLKSILTDTANICHTFKWHRIR
jgi:O-antigen/teichoic acid export membrane protein